MIRSLGPTPTNSPIHSDSTTAISQTLFGHGRCTRSRTALAALQVQRIDHETRFVEDEELMRDRRETGGGALLILRPPGSAFLKTACSVGEIPIRMDNPMRILNSRVLDCLLRAIWWVSPWPALRCDPPGKIRASQLGMTRPLVM